MSSKGLHVVPRGGKWTVRSAGATRTSGTFDTQEQAELVARERAIARCTELYIHGRDGRIRERSSFGKDLVSSKG